jgi:hypothetical protein
MRTRFKAASVGRDNKGEGIIPRLGGINKYKYSYSLSNPLYPFFISLYSLSYLSLLSFYNYS